MNAHALITSGEIQRRIHNMRGVQVMLDSDLAALYGVEVKKLNQQVKRNKDRFPEEFCFQLTADEGRLLRSQFATLKDESLRSQIVTLKGTGKHRKYLPYAFTEQGVAMLSAVLKSDTAVRTSIQIINAFVAMRRFIAANAEVFQRLAAVERKQSEHKAEVDHKFEEIFNAIEERDIKPKQGIFFEGQIFDAHQFVSNLIRTAKKSIVLIDNYIDDRVLTLLSKAGKKVRITILTRSITRQLALDIEKYNAQCPPLAVREFDHAHDRFLIIDDRTVYHFGASLKDLGKKWFAFSRFDKAAFKLLERVEEVLDG